MSTKQNINVVETQEYDSMLQRITFKKVSDYLKKNQGNTIDNILEEFGETNNRQCMEHLMCIWIDRWNTFFRSGGRIVQKSDRFYCLSPRNPESRKRIPNIVVNM